MGVKIPAVKMRFLRLDFVWPLLPYFGKQMRIMAVYSLLSAPFGLYLCQGAVCGMLILTGGGEMMIFFKRSILEALQYLSREPPPVAPVPIKGPSLR